MKFFGTLAVLFFPAVFCLADEQPPAGDEQLWAEAEARIEKHRKADALVTVRDAEMQPLADAKVHVQQKRHAFLFGCNIFRWGNVGDGRLEAEYRRRFAEVFNYATLPFYWWAYEQTQGQPIHARIEQVARWCNRSGIRCKGHPLAWNYKEPRWLPDDLQKVRSLQMARIKDCVQRFDGVIDSWDVVNEATHFEREELKRRAPKLTEAWTEMGRLEFTRECFRRARQANSKATLLINDYRVDPPYAALIEQLVDDDGPLYDVIGIQSHQHGGTWTNRKIWDVCERFARFHVPLHFTETTVLSGKLGWRLGDRGQSWPTTPAGESYQAREVERFYTMVYSHPAVEALTWWDFSDGGAWQGAPAGFLRADMSAKPAYQVLRNLIKRKWWTETTITTDKDGTAKFRGTLGDYEITVRVPGREPVQQNVTLSRDKDHRFVIIVP